MSEQIYTVLFAGAVRDAEGVDHRPGAVMVDDCGKVVMAGPPEAMPELVIPRQETVHLPNKLLLPAMVNAHTHLELTELGPQPYDPAGGFVGWVKMLRSNESDMAGRWVESAMQGAAKCREAGVQAVGDIARSDVVADVPRLAGLAGRSDLELFGLGPPYDQTAIQAINQVHERGSENIDSYHQLGVQPHAPYSAGHSIFRAASQTEKYYRCSTHLAETRDEVEFVGSLSGPLFDFVRSIGRWDDSFAGRYGQGLSPVQWIQPYLEASYQGDGYGLWLVAHCNYVSDEDIEILAKTNTSVAYCPIASEYFGHTGHRYRDMLAAGVNVCLGTDSIVCADPNDPHPLGVFNAMRRLYRRDGTHPATLLAMATFQGARALVIGMRFGTLSHGVDARFACIDFDPANPEDPLQQVLKNDNPIKDLDYTGRKTL